MKCPYNSEIQCEYVDTAGMDKIKECEDCPHFVEDNRIRATGATPILAYIIDNISKIFSRNEQKK